MFQKTSRVAVAILEMKAALRSDPQPREHRPENGEEKACLPTTLRSDATGATSLCRDTHAKKQTPAASPQLCSEQLSPPAASHQRFPPRELASPLPFIQLPSSLACSSPVRQARSWQLRAEAQTCTQALCPTLLVSLVLARHTPP